jgi:hypothetical protein
MDQLLTIGALAERCGLSRSALRFYDQCGLVRPVVVDETARVPSPYRRPSSMLYRPTWVSSGWGRRG